MKNQILAGSFGDELALSISTLSHMKLVNTAITRFADKELKIEVEKLDGCTTVFIVQSLAPNASDAIMELLLLTDAARRSLNPDQVVAIIPYFAYARQDRVMSRFIDSNTEMSSALSPKVVATIIQAAGVNKIITVDLHSQQLVGFFNIPLVSLDCSSVFIDFAVRNVSKEIAIVAPDVGALPRARSFAKKLSEKNHADIEVVVIDKLRTKPGVSTAINVLGNVKNKHCIIVDDIIDSGGTIYNAANMLKNKGAEKVDGYITHAILSGEAIANLVNSSLDNLILTNTINHGNKLKGIEKITIVSIAEFLYDNLHK